MHFADARDWQFLFEERLCSSLSLCWAKGNWYREREHMRLFRAGPSLEHPLRVSWELTWGAGGTNLVATAKSSNRAAHNDLWLTVTCVGKGGDFPHCSLHPQDKCLAKLPSCVTCTHRQGLHKHKQISVNSAARSCVRHLLVRLSGILNVCKSRKVLWLGGDYFSRSGWQRVSGQGQPACL